MRCKPVASTSDKQALLKTSLGPEAVFPDHQSLAQSLSPFFEKVSHFKMYALFWSSLEHFLQMLLPAFCRTARSERIKHASNLESYLATAYSQKAFQLTSPVLDIMKGKKCMVQFSTARTWLLGMELNLLLFADLPPYREIWRHFGLRGALRNYRGQVDGLIHYVQASVIYITSPCLHGSRCSFSCATLQAGICGIFCTFTSTLLHFSSWVQRTKALHLESKFPTRREKSWSHIAHFLYCCHGHPCVIRCGQSFAGLMKEHTQQRASHAIQNLRV